MADSPRGPAWTRSKKRFLKPAQHRLPMGAESALPRCPAAPLGRVQASLCDRVLANATAPRLEAAASVASL
eukprot:5477954-Alexandrium_andersonii.AAC.1